MPKTYPRRAESHRLEEESVRFFKSSLPKHWTAEKPQPDYGVDLKVDIFEDGFARGLEILVQIKGTEQPSGGDVENVRLKTATYNMLKEKLQVAILVKFVASENEAYWTLLKSVPPPPQDNEQFTVHIPRTNRLSVAPWDEIHAYVRAVTEGKLSWRDKAKLFIPGTE